MTKIENKYDNFSKAVKRLNEANIAYKKNTDNDIYQDALIKRYEFTFELAWKTLYEFMSEQGFKLGLISPKGIFSTAYQYGLIDDEEIWLAMLEARNLTAHDYGREISEDIADKISTRFCKALTALNRYFAENIK